MLKRQPLPQPCSRDVCQQSQALAWFLQLEATSNIVTPPGWDVSPLRITPSILSPVPIYTPGWRETIITGNNTVIETRP